MPEDVTPKRPASQYYWGDWFKDLALQSCSLPARGLWHEMNCLMHQGEPYGHLTLPNGKPMGPQQLANLCKIPAPLCKRLLEELMSNGVPSVDAATGAYFSRRMVRDEQLREQRAEAGRANGAKGAGFGAMGAEHGRKGGRPRKLNGDGNGGNEPGENPPTKPPQEPGENPHPSSSSSSSSSENTSCSSPPVKPSGKARPSKRVPADFVVTPGLEEWVRDNARSVDWRRETEKFRDWEYAKPHTDWPAAWRTWMRNAQEKAEQKGSSINGHVGDDWAARAL